MRPTRRRLLQAGGLAGLAGVAGCLGVLGGGDGGDGSTPTPTTEDRPNGVYVQPFVERMAMAGTAQAGDYAFGVMWTNPHRFWTPTQAELSEQPKKGAMHLMSVVWDPETQTVLPETGLSVEVARDGELVSQEVIYPMLSQRMGFHYGGNFGLDGDGTYQVRVSVSGMPIRRTGAFEGKFGEPATAEVPLEFTEATREQVGAREVDAAGQAGAVSPMQMEMMPQNRVPTLEELPGQDIGTATSDDANLSALFLPPDMAGRYADGTGYLVVLAATPYNRIVLPAMGLEAELTRGGSTLGAGRLERTLDPDLGYHYGLPVDADSIESGDTLSLSVTTPPQVSRHEGYETAFLQMDGVEITA